MTHIVKGLLTTVCMLGYLLPAVQAEDKPSDRLLPGAYDCVILQDVRIEKLRNKPTVSGKFKPKKDRFILTIKDLRQKSELACLDHRIFTSKKQCIDVREDDRIKACKRKQHAAAIKDRDAEPHLPESYAICEARYVAQFEPSPLAVTYMFSKLRPTTFFGQKFVIGYFVLDAWDFYGWPFKKTAKPIPFVASSTLPPYTDTLSGTCASVSP